MIISSGVHIARLACPECGGLVPCPISISSILTVTAADGATLKAKVGQKPVPHVCGAADNDLFTAATDEG